MPELPYLPGQSPALSDHQHSRVMPNSVDTAAIQTDAVTSDKIAADAVGSSEIAADAVGTSEIAPLSVTGAELAALAVGVGKIAADSVGNVEILDGQVGTGELASNAVTTIKITDGAVTEAKLDAQLAKGHRFETSATSNSAGATAETVVLTISSATFTNNRAYKISYGSAVASASANGEVAMTVRKTDATGTVYGGPTRHLCGVTANSTCDASGERYVKRTAGSDLTTDVVLTIQGVIGGNAAHIGSATLPRYLLIEDIGDAGDYGFAVAVT